MTTAQSTEDALPATIVELIVLGDDGTMDTVVYCTKCGQEFRGNWDGGGTDDGLPHRSLDDDSYDDSYDDYVDWLIADVTAEHECPKQ